MSRYTYASDFTGVMSIVSGTSISQQELQFYNALHLQLLKPNRSKAGKIETKLR
jgi:hypothetical protein